MTAQTAGKPRSRIRGWQSNELPLATGRHQIKRATRRDDGTTKGARDNYSWLESRQPPPEGWTRYVTRTWGLGRYKLIDPRGKESHLEVDEAMVNAVSKQAPAMNPPDEGEGNELAERVGQLEEALGDLRCRFDDLVAELEANAEEEEEAADEQEEQRAANPGVPALSPVEEIIKQKKLMAELDATIGGSNFDFEGVLKLGLQTFLATRGAAPQAVAVAQNPSEPVTVTGEDEQWKELVKQAREIGLTPVQVQDYLLKALRAPNASPAQP